MRKLGGVCLRFGKDVLRGALPAGMLSEILHARRRKQEGVIDSLLGQLRDEGAPSPVEFVVDADGRIRIDGPGAYLRLDYWVKLSSGGSYGHTCYVAHELNRTMPGLTCYMAHPYDLLDTLGVRQVPVPVNHQSCSSTDLLLQGFGSVAWLQKELEKNRPSYVYERIVLGNPAGALLSKRLGIPYIVEYNGSEFEMNRSFGSGAMEFENELKQVETWALRQASVITVVSSVIRDSLVAQGIDARRIMINPNGVDPAAYAPATIAEKEVVRGKLGFSQRDRVVCFSGTFGGWHGVDVLAEALPRIVASCPQARFLFIGDGNCRHLVDEAVARHGLQHQVVCTGRVPQAESASLYRAADVFVSPHSQNMASGPFFGSPTKVFEYMGMGGGIVASDLEQIGQVLRPAILWSDDVSSTTPVVDEKAILCPPGDVDAFVGAVCFLVENPGVCAALGANARASAVEGFSWESHVARLWRFVSVDVSASWSGCSNVATATSCNDRHGTDKSESGHERGRIDRSARQHAQDQWNTNPCGALGSADCEGLEYFYAVEKFRYAEQDWMHDVVPFSAFSGKKVLEIGVGLGTDLAQFAAHGARCHGIDITDRHMDLTRRNFAARGYEVDIRKCDATKICYPDATFDCVYSFGVIHHIPEAEKVFAECWRVLRPGGVFFVGMYNFWSVYHFVSKLWYDGLLQRNIFRLGYDGLLATIESGADGVNIKPYVKLYSRRELVRDVGRAGFDVECSGAAQLKPSHFYNPGRLVKRFWPIIKRMDNHWGWYVYAMGRKGETR